MYGIFGIIKITSLLFLKKLISVLCLTNNINLITLKCIFAKNKVKIFHIDNINSDESVSLLKNLDLDLIISVSSSIILKNKILNLPKYGCINIHNAKLPKNRGMMPIFWALYNSGSDPISAITIHKMNESIDDGEILLQEDFEINPNYSMEFYIKKTKLRGAELLIELLMKYEHGEPESITNNSKNSSYNRFPDKYQIKEFKKKGYKII